MAGGFVESTGKVSVCPALDGGGVSIFAELGADFQLSAQIPPPLELEQQEGIFHSVARLLILS